MSAPREAPAELRATRTAQASPSVAPTRRTVLALPPTSWLAAWPGAASWPAAAAAAPRRAFGEMVGLQVKFSQGQPEAELALLPQLRVRWVRDAVHWPQIEPAAGRYADFTPAFARQLAFYGTHDIGLVALLTLGNSRAYRGADERFDATAFGRFARQVARMLGESGVRFVLEIGNEPHSSELAKHFGGAWNGRPPSPWLQHYLRMAHAAVAEVKSLDPRIRLLVDDDMWVIHHRYIEAGLPPRIDGFAVHPYTPGPPERTAVAHDTEWTRPFTVVDADRSFASAVRRLREAAARALRRQPEVWVTEWGWAAGAQVRHGVAPELVAAYLPRAFVLAAEAGVEVLCWFSAHDAVDGPMGLVRHSGARRPAFDAFATMTAQLAAHHLVRRAAGGSGLQAFVFADARGARKLVAWSADGRERRLPWSRVAIAAGADGLGRALDRGAATVVVDALPRYLPIDERDDEVDERLAAAA